MTLNPMDRDTSVVLCTSLNSVFGKKLIESFAAHDPERCISRQFGHHRILEAPTEIHLADHLLHRWFERKRKPLLNRSRHATTAGFHPEIRIFFHHNNAMACGSEMKGGCPARCTSADDQNIAAGWNGFAHTFRMAASLSASCFSSSTMNLSSTFCTESCSSRL